MRRLPSLPDPLEAYAVRAPPRTRIEADSILATERLDATVETAVYFCCLEACRM